MRLRIINIGELKNPSVDERFHWQARVDPLGRKIHLVCALIWCVLLAGPTSVVELAGIPLLICSLVRLDKGIATMWPAMKSPLLWAILAWYGCMALSVAWSSDPHQGWEEVLTIRWLVLMGLLWPVLDRRDLLVCALALGFLLANASQVAHMVGNAFGLEWLTFDRKPGRNSGWLDPVVGGSLLVGALGLHLPEALMGPNRVAADAEAPPRTRLPGILGCAITIPAIFVTGTRGAWITGTMLIGASVAYALGRVRPVRRLVVGVVVVGVLGAGGAVGAWYAIGDDLRARWHAGVSEVTRAMEEGDYDSDTGARVLMWRVALDAAARRPVNGIGAGGFRDAMDAYVEREQITRSGGRRHDHAHSAPLHMLATLGVPGLLLASVVVFLALRGGVRGPEEQRAGYGLAPAFALGGLLLAGLFDSVQVNMQTSALLFTLLTLCHPARPRLHQAYEREREAA